MFVADISDECLLGTDFLKKVNLENVFESFFTVAELNERRICYCSRIENASEKVPSILKELFINNSENLNKAQKETFAEFL